jgi:hypothetical protein
MMPQAVLSERERGLAGQDDREGDHLDFPWFLPAGVDHE